MAAYEVLLLNTAVPQIQAAQSGDTYVVPRDIAFSAALTLSAGTANGVPYLNGSKVLTTGSALTFDGTNLGVGVSPSFRLDVGGAMRAAGDVWISGGTATARRLNFDASGTYYNWIESDGGVGAGYTRFAVNNSEQMRLTSTGLGIGTSSPGYKLDVAGSGRFGTGTGNPIVFINGGSSSGNGGYVQFQKAGANNFYVGHVSGVVGGTSNDGLLYNSSGNGLQIYTNNALAATLDSSGNLGIGTSSPVAKLDISNIGATQNGLRLTNFSGAAELASFTTDTSTGEIRIGGTNGAAGSYYPVFYAGGSERARITSGGDLLVGTTSGAVTVNGLKFFSNGSFYSVQNSGVTSSIYNKSNYTSGTDFFADFRLANTTVGSISANGSTTSYNTSSDRRLKENIAPAADAGAVIDAIEVIQHDWKAGGHTRYGVVAQDLNAVAPEAVTQGDDGDEIERTWGVDYSKLVPMLIKEIQSLRARVAALESQP